MITFQKNNGSVNAKKLAEYLGKSPSHLSKLKSREPEEFMALYFCAVIKANNIVLTIELLKKVRDLQNLKEDLSLWNDVIIRNVYTGEVANDIWYLVISFLKQLIIKNLYLIKKQ